jgi:hypothetical protein
MTASVTWPDSGSRAGLSGRWSSWPAPPTAAFCLQIAVSERFVRAWDLAVATGQPHPSMHLF